MCAVDASLENWLGSHHLERPVIHHCGGSVKRSPLGSGYFYSLIISFLMPYSSNFYTELDGNYQILYLWWGERLTTFLDNKKACKYW